MAVSQTTSAAPDNLTVCVHYLVQQDRVSVAITLRNALQLGAHVIAAACSGNVVLPLQKVNGASN